MKYFIITGASRGLGEGIAMALLDENHHLLCVSRSESDALKKMAAAKNCLVDFFLYDLSVSHDIPKLFKLILSSVNTDNTEGIYLINNAGVIEPVGRIESNDQELVERHIRINLLAPMALTAAFIDAFKGIAIQKRILNISSGAATSAYYGWSSYCTSKAGIDMFSRCMAVEQENTSSPVEVMAVAPGIIDTDMQTTIRGTTEEQFIHKQKFVGYKESGMLVAPALAGKNSPGFCFPMISKTVQ
jgi:benzil reductase ((S)-benzoin forming)